MLAGVHGSPDLWQELSLHYRTPANPQNTALSTYHYPHFGKKKAGPERVSTLPRATPLVMGSGMALLSFYGAEFLIKVSSTITVLPLRSTCSSLFP